MKTNNKFKIIPDILFHQLTSETEKYPSQMEYRQSIARFDSKYYKKLIKCGLSENEIYDLLTNIYMYSRMPFKLILSKAKTSKSKVSHRFCIPIRTVENWYAGTSPCPFYISLMILKSYHLLDLGKYVKLENDIEYQRSKPLIYEHSDDYELKQLSKKAKEKSKKHIPDEKPHFASDYLKSQSQLAKDMAYLDVIFEKNGKMRSYKDREPLEKEF